MATQNNAINSNRNRNTTIFVSIAVLLVAVFFVNSFGSGSANDVFTQSTELPDNQLTKDSELAKFEQEGELVQVVQEEEATYNVTYDDSTNEFTFDCITTCATEDQIILSNNELSNIIELDLGTETIVNAWVNKDYDVGGFAQTFEAFLIEKEDSSRHTLVYRIGNERFIITDLNLYDGSGIDPAINTIVNNRGIDQLYVKGEQQDLIENNIVSVVGVASDGELIIFRNEIHAFNSFVNRVVKRGFNTITSEAFAGGVLIYQSEGGSTGFNRVIYQFAVDELETYSFDSLALDSNTRTVGFDVASIVKQELTLGENSFPDRYAKILSQQNFDTILEEANDQLTPFITDRIADSLSTDVNNVISIDGGLVALELGNDLEGIILENGYFGSDRLQNGTAIVVSQIEFDEQGSLGVQFTDLGQSTLNAGAIEISSFGNLRDGFELTTLGTGYLLDLDQWSRAIGVVANFFVFDFSGVSQFWTQEVTNPTLADLVVGDGEDIFAFNTFARNSNTDALTLTSQQPLDLLLQFEGNNYWLFYAFETIDNGEGCMIIDYLNTEIGERIPATICGDIIAGSNAVSQFKIASGDDVQ